MSISKAKVRANLIIDKDLKKKLEEIAKSKNRSFNNLIITVLQDYLESAEK
jgi:predicted HicB family RNase H-like nuclease